MSDPFEPGANNIVVCGFRTTLPDGAVPGSVDTTCDDCGAAIIASPASMAHRHEARFVCWDCMPKLPPVDEFRAMPGAYREMAAMGLDGEAMLRRINNMLKARRS